MTRRNFLLQKENDCKVQLRFVKCCTLVVTEGYHILLSPLNRLVRCHFIMFRMYIIRTSWEHNQRKRKCSENCHIIKEYRYLKNAIYKLERNEWLLLSAFQQSLRQKLVFVLTQENAFS